ncbi:class I SAM-dependent methyltransferase [Kitasatospora sp. NPDC002040]|uniref:class I SAM-dependent methyltransferase n=1 Tax=Kitasatospora sp. NPDC002040 TaxID=3154661 RepID=UPI00333014B0
MSESPFDALAAMYEEFSELPFRQQLEFPSVLALVGPPQGLRILDLGCGSGVYCRYLAANGADTVTGLDRSAGMIDYARRREGHECFGIRYLQDDLPPALAGTFDLVLSVYVLPYATTYDELLALCRTAADALRPGGRFLTLPIHPDPDHYTRYGFRMYQESSREDGAPVGLDLRFGSHDAHLTARYWSAPTLERALTEAGFQQHRWHAHRTSRHAAGDPFYQPYLDAPHAAIVETVRGAEQR